jgi:carboxypeptidase T
LKGRILYVWVFILFVSTICSTIGYTDSHDSFSVVRSDRNENVRPRIEMVDRGPFALVGAGVVLPLTGLLQGTASFNHDLYHTYDEVNAILLSRSEQYDGSPKPNIVRLFNIGQTHEGRDIYAIKISDNPVVNEPMEKEILFNGSHHANELVGVEITLDLMDVFLTKYESNDPAIKAIVDTNEIWLIPLMNPDGHVKVEQGLDWRKNTSLYPGQDENNKGVDLNRNYGFRWNDCGITPLEKTTRCKGMTDPIYGSYSGPGPFSEEETQAIRDFVNDTSKVDGFSFSLSWHSSGGEILYPWHFSELVPYKNEYDKAWFDTGARVLQEAIAQARAARGEPAEGYDIVHPYRYLTGGSSDDWLYAEKNIIAFSIEAYGEEEGNAEPPNSEFNPSTQEILDKVIENNIAASLALITFQNPFRTYLPSLVR